MIVDRDMNILPARRGPVLALVALTCALTRDAMSSSVEAPEFLDVEMNDLAGPFTFVTWPWFDRLERR